MQNGQSSAISEIAPSDDLFDVAVIGAGVVGCAMTRRFALAGARVVLLERARDILAGASKGNSGLLHTGFDAPPGSLELACIRAGHAEYMRIKDRLHLPTIDKGAVVAAFTEGEVDRLEGMRQKAQQNGVPGVRLLNRQQIFEREPFLAPSCRAGLWIPGECAIDPWAAPLAYLQQAIENGAQVRFGAGITDGVRADGVWRLNFASGRIFAKTVINCAGLYGDLLDQQLLGRSTFTIRPRKGQFVVFDKAAAQFLNAILLPIPQEHTKGVLLTRTVFGHVLVGPTAEEQQDRSAALPDPATSRRLIAKAVSIIPALADVPPIAAYAGLRPATELPGYRIDVLPERGWMTVGGIRSTGLSSALGLAQHIWEQYSAAWPAARPAEIASPVWPAENKPASPDTSEIVCQCEQVTADQIAVALAGPLPARDLGGLKRRTRVALGACQGEACLPRVAQIAGDRIAPFQCDRRPFFAGSVKIEDPGK